VTYFIRLYENNDHPFGISKKNFVKAVNKFANECHWLIKGAVIDFSNYQNFIQEIEDTFYDVLDLLYTTCYESSEINTYETPHEEYESVYPGHEDDLLQLGIHNPDHRILLVCYFFKINEFEKETAFITKDGTILKKSNEIEDLLEGIFIHTT
jgi:hypothetical protein